MKNGALVITTQKINFSKGGKVYSDYVVGRYTGHNSRVIADVEGGYIEVSTERLKEIAGTTKITLSSLGAGVVETYLPSTKDAVDKFLAGTIVDLVGRKCSSLPWKSEPTKGPLLLLKTVVVEG